MVSTFNFLTPQIAYQAIKAKQNTGTMNAVAIVELSAINPIAGGQKAPPATAITRKDEPFFVSVPKSATPSAKIVGNMIDIKKYVVNNENTETQPISIITITTNMVLIMAYRLNKR